MAKTRQQAQPAQAQHPTPGSQYRWPGVGVQPRIVQEIGPCAEGTTIALNQASAASAPFQKFQQLDIVQSYILELDFTTTYTAGTGTVTASPLFPANIISNIQVQFESAYNTFNLPGFLAVVFQSYRSVLGPHLSDSQRVTQGVGGVPAAGGGATPAELGASFYAPYVTAPPLATPGLAPTTAGAAQSWKLLIEIPISITFDVYWDLAINGQIQGPPVYRACVSPSYMAATTRNVTPKLKFASLLGTTDSLDSPATGTGDATATGTVNASWYRDGWIPSSNPATSPPVYGWQYSRDYLELQPSQARIFPVTLDDSVVGQGQIMSLFFFTWDPTLNGGDGGIVPIANYETVELLYGSTVQLRQQTPTQNLLEWSTAHGAFLPSGVMGWDLARTRDGRLTNENLLNSLVQAGSQLRITYLVGSQPSAGSTLFVGIESLKKIGV